MPENEPSFRLIQPSFKVTLASQVNYEKTVEGLGKICVEFQRLEGYLKTAISLLLVPDDFRLGTIVTAQLSFPATLDLFYALYHHRFPDPQSTLKDLNKFLEKCGKAATRRNEIVHSYWIPDLESGKGAIRLKHTAKNRKELKHQRETLSRIEMGKIAAELQSLRNIYMQDWADRINTWALMKGSFK